MSPATKKATFGAGCFWGVEAAFRQIPGVIETTVGYLGGTMANPTYHDVCTGRTGHAEVVEVEYDPSRVSYDELVAAFWQLHDPTTLNRQGWDVGTQYRSAIFFHDAEQEASAHASKAALQSRSKKQIVTEITPASPFYPAEEYHQRYLEKQGRTSCALPTAEGSHTPSAGDDDNHAGQNNAGGRPAERRWWDVLKRT